MLIQQWAAQEIVGKSCGQCTVIGKDRFHTDPAKIGTRGFEATDHNAILDLRFKYAETQDKVVKLRKLIQTKNREMISISGRGKQAKKKEASIEIDKQRKLLKKLVKTLNAKSKKLHDDYNCHPYIPGAHEAFGVWRTDDINEYREKIASIEIPYLR